MKNVTELRNEIDALDENIVEFLEERFSVCEKIWNLKRVEGSDLKDLDREKEVKEKFRKANLPEGFVDGFFELFFREVD